MRDTHRRHHMTAAAERARERRAREDAEPRLQALVPALRSLSLEIRDARPDDFAPGVIYVSRIVVERAPASFDLRCQEPDCKEGGHDLTGPIMRALRGAERRFEGEHICRGDVGQRQCGRLLRYVGRADFSS